MCTYLSKRGATYYFRRVIPIELRPAFGGKAQFMVSLRTKDRDRAKQLIPAQTMASEKQLDAARGQLGKSPKSAPETPQRPSTRHAEIEGAQADYEEEAAAFFEQEDLAREARQEARQHYHDLYHRRMRLTTQQLEPWEAAIKDMLAERDFDLAVANDRLAYYEERLKAAKEGRPDDLLSAPAKAVVAAPAGHGKGILLDTAILERWAAERKPRRKTVDAYRAVAEWFYERAGRLSVEQITRSHVLAFKDALLAEGQSPENINVKLGRLKTLLNYAVSNDYAASNAADGIRVKEAGKNKRQPFNLPALQAIFGSPVYAKGERPTRGRGEAAYGMPLLALFAGARLEEIGQLRVSDLQRHEYPGANDKMESAWFLDITEYEDEDVKRELKNDGSRRIVPLHPGLERLGFVAYVQGLPDQSGRIFPLLKPGAYGRLTAKWGEWFSEYRRKVCGITDRRMVFHSFRHTFKDYARHAGIVEGVQRQLMGHSGDDVADDYGSGYSLHQLVQGMRLYRVPGLKLPAPSQDEGRYG